MTTAVELAIDQLDALLAQIEPKIKPQRSGSWFTAPEAEREGMETRALAALDRLAPAGSSYRVKGQQAAQKWVAGKSVVALAGILRALRDDYSDGYMRGIEESVRADVFSDFLEMADHLMRESKDAAAVIAGGVLEQHLRKLAAKHGVAVTAGARPVKADTLNAGLVKAGAYNKLTQKSVTAWLDLRNNAAHAHYDEYDRAHVEAMIRDVRSFTERHPA